MRAESAVDSFVTRTYRGGMSSRSTLAITVGALAILGCSACKSVYSDTFSYRKNSFKAPVEKAPDIKVPLVPNMQDPGLGAGAPIAPMDGGAIPGIPGIPAAPDAAPGVPAVPAVPGL